MDFARRVHVVDDELAVRESAAALLGKLGHYVARWPSAEQFLATGNPRPDECILLDLFLDGCDGFAMLERLRARGTTTPVVMLTRFSDRWLEQEIFAQGALSILIKPFGQGGLARAVSEAFAAGTAAAPPPSAGHIPPALLRGAGE